MDILLKPLVTVIACAGQDKTLSIWNTSSSRPLVVCQDLAGKSISDLAWTPDGSTIFASSLDGSIIALELSEASWDMSPPGQKTRKHYKNLALAAEGWAWWRMSLVFV